MPTVNHVAVAERTFVPFRYQHHEPGLYAVTAG